MVNDPEWPGYHKWHLRQVAQISAKLTPGQSNPGKTKNYGKYYTWTRSCSLLESKIQFLQSGSDSIVVEEAAKNF